MLMVSTEAEV